MTQIDKIVSFLRGSGGSATLGQLLDAGRFDWAHKLTARISDARKQGHHIICERGENPSKNLYILKEDKKDNYPEPKYHYDEYGVGAFNF